jgi:hypothetical protein
MARGATRNYAELRGPASKDTQVTLKRHRWPRALAAAILVGGPVAAVMFLPGVRVDPEGPMDPANPYPISFKIADANFIPLNNVNVYLEICYLAAAPAPVRLPCQPPFKTRMFKAAWRDHALAVDQPFTITLDDFLRFTAPDKFAGADISIIVEYQPWNFPIRQEKEFRFATEPDSDGKLHWTTRPLEE